MGDKAQLDTPALDAIHLAECDMKRPLAKGYPASSSLRR
jgi:hypothetical protein